MDFRRIEIIFLVAFFGLNIFLFSSYQETKATDATRGQDITTNLEDRLSNDKIKTNKKFSKKHAKGYYLTGEITDFKSKLASLNNQTAKIVDNQVQSSFDSEIKVEGSKTKQIEKVKKIVKKNIAFSSDYSYLSEISQTDNQFVFSQSWEGIPFNDETAQITIYYEQKNKNDYVLKNYVQGRLEKIEPLREKQELITEREAIATLYTNMKLPSNSTILWTKLAYFCIFTAQNKNVYIPVWFVGIENSKNNVQVERVNAFTNAVLTTSLSEVKN